MLKAALSITEVADQSSSSKRTICRRIAEGKLKARKNGHRTVVLKEDFEAFLAALPASRQEAA